jgi:hypothetical protein
MLESIGKDLVYHREGVGSNSQYLQPMCIPNELG